MRFNNYYKSDTVKIEHLDGRNRVIEVVNERFENRKDLRKLVVRLMFTGCIVTVNFDDISIVESNKKEHEKVD